MLYHLCVGIVALITVLTGTNFWGRKDTNQTCNRTLELQVSSYLIGENVFTCLGKPWCLAAGEVLILQDTCMQRNLMVAPCRISLVWTEVSLKACVSDEVRKTTALKLFCPVLWFVMR